MNLAAAVLFGFMAGTLCNFATQLKFVFGYDDCLDIFASHAIGGMIGNVSFIWWRPKLNRWSDRVFIVDLDRSLRPKERGCL